MTYLRRLSAALLALGALIASGCGDDDAPSTCIPGESRACVGRGGCAGGQVCLPDGMSLGDCVCDADVDAGRPMDGGPMDGGDPGDAMTDGFAPDSPMTPTHTFDARDFMCVAGMTPVCETTEPARTAEERTREIDMPLDGVQTTDDEVTSLGSSVPEPSRSRPDSMRTPPTSQVSPGGSVVTFVSEAPSDAPLHT